ncbi:MAG TPA: hypothetical protein DDW50_03510 [Firmicutes bacterium]|jgi:hypothetical protein|nr:hypothetical protein [Bacillota bacterium]
MNFQGLNKFASLKLNNKDIQYYNLLKFYIGYGCYILYIFYFLTFLNGLVISIKGCFCIGYSYDSLPIIFKFILHTFNP